MTVSAQIAKQISTTDVAFNAGGEAGVVVGATATIFNDTEVSDPATGEPLGVVRRPSLTFRITEVQPKLSVGTTVGTVTKPTQAGDALLRALQASERIRVTLDEKARDYRTRFIQIGQHVEITPPDTEPT